MEPPIRIPGIETDGELGRGAYSVVFRGRHGRTPCAVKVPRWGGRSHRWFRREAVALARVQDPGLPAVMEVGEAEGVPYLVMELAEGEPLADRLRRGRLTEDEVVDLGMQLCRTLSAVHRRGLVHRDIKPSNIVIEPGTGRVRLVDFGFVAQVDRHELGEAAGTRDYAAPEQMDAPRAPDARADLYALGVVMYECLTGNRPSGRMAGGADPEALQRRLEKAGASAGIVGVLLGLLAPDPANRYSTAAPVLRDLERVQTGLDPLGASVEVFAEGGALPLFGRKAELERLTELWREASHGQGSVLLIEGAPGSGKTRLLAALRERIRSTHMFSAGCQEGDPAPLAVMRQLFDGYISGLAGVSVEERRRIEDMLREAASDHLADLVALVSPGLADVLGQPRIATPARDIHEAFVESMVEFIRRFVRNTGPLLLCVDDLQWADPVSLDILVRLAHRASGVPLLLVGAGRPDDGSGPMGRFRSSLGEDRLERVSLGSLGEEDTVRMLEAYLGVEDLDPRLLQRVRVLSDGTPLSVLEILEALIDHGVLAPHWGSWRFDAVAAEEVFLPRGTLAILRRRLGSLPAASRALLESASVIGATFDQDLLARVNGVDPADLEAAMAEVRHAGLVERIDRHRHRFVHDQVREALLGDMPEARRRLLHRRTAEALDGGHWAGAEAVYEIASHHALGAPDTDPHRTFETCLAAGERAAARFDNDAAVRFLEWACAAAERGKLPIGVELYRQLGETRLRVGLLQESLEAFRVALGRVRVPAERAEILGRIAWVHQTRADPERAWEVLRAAFSELGTTMPEEDAASLSRTAAAFARAQLRARRGVPPRLGGAEEARLRVLADLHYQNARLGLEYGRVLRFLQSTLRVLDVAAQLGPGQPLAKSYAMYGFAMTALGRRKVGLGYLDRGEYMARRLGDPVLFAYCRQLQSTARYWTGEVETANLMTRRTLQDLGHWFEASEYCMAVDNARIVEALRGRPLHEWTWAELAIERVRRSGRAPAAFLVTERGGRAALTALGREDEIPVLEGRLWSVHRSSGVEEGFFGLVSWGARIRAHTERGDLGEAFDQEVAAFEAEGHDPSKAHIVLYEYYAHVAHARVHQCLRAAPGARSEHLARLDGALSDLRRTARAPIAKAHAEVVGGYHAFFRGDHRGARRHFGKAERLADRENMPWVLYAVARGEAHLLRAEGYDEAARERARIAAAIAREHGAVHRLRWVGEEFDLRPSSPPPPRSTRSSTAEASSRRRRQLQTLLQVVRASSRDLHLEQQARAVLDELVNTFAAEEGYLVYESEPGQTLRIGSAGGNGKVGRAVDGPVVQRVQRTGEPWIGGPLPAAVEDADQTGHVLAAPLVIKERVVGVVTVQRGRLEEPYTPEDRDLLVALAHQVLSALELTRLLEQRERLEESLRQAQKMEAVGRLAGGIAHDFNNMLTVIEASVEALRDRSAPGRSSSSDLEMIEDAAQRAKTLTRQLLAFSRRQVVHPEVHEPNAILSDLAPMLGRLIGEHIKVELQLDPHAHPVKVDRSFFEQAIVNLAANARDAMPKGGTITLLTENLVLDEEFTRDRPSIRPGPHVHVAVSDTGEGMPPDVQARIFDPFFTTKQLSGTGLGLSTVYGFATQSEGYIEVESETGRGTTFHLYLPKAREALRRPSTAPPAPRERMGSETVLLVEDERLVRNSVRRILQRAGYRVLTAEGGREALGLADRHGKEIALVVTDVLMPDMSGPELVERLRERLPNARVLYMSGYTDGHLVAHGVLEEGVSLLHKPFTSGELQERIRELLDDQ